MADEKKTLKFQMMMSPAEAEVLDDWMFNHRVRSRAEAIRRLIQIGLRTQADYPAIIADINKAYDETRKSDDLFAPLIKGGDIPISDPKSAAEYFMKAATLLLKIRSRVADAAIKVMHLERQISTFHSAGEVEKLIEDAENARQRSKDFWTKNADLFNASNKAMGDNDEDAAG